jgi:membrane protein required for colicin V production
MNFLDIIILIPLLWFTYKGFVKGFVIELAMLAALLLGIYAALHFSGFTADFLTKQFEMKPQVLNLVSFAVTFIVVIFLVYLVGKGLEKVINLVMLGFINKLAGAAFGLIKTAFILSVLIYFINQVDKTNTLLSKENREESFLFNHVESIAPAIFPMLRLDEIKELIDGEEEEEVIV